MIPAARRAWGDEGTAFVEAALILPILVIFLLGVITGGMAYNSDIQLSHATREGARFGATIPVDQDFASGTWATNVRDLVRARSAGDLEDSTICVALVIGETPVAYSTNHTTAGETAPCYDDSGSGEAGLRVQVAGTKPTTIETGFMSYDVVLSAEATAKHETAQY